MLCRILIVKLLIEMHVSDKKIIINILIFSSNELKRLNLSSII